MKTTIIHISDLKGNKRVKFCDGTPNDPPGQNDKNPKELCEKCRLAFVEPKVIRR